jgi:hypothetical protein
MEEDHPNYVIFDNFEFTGKCGMADFAVMGCGTSYSTFTKWYMHGWTYTAANGAQNAEAIRGNTGGCSPWPQTNNTFSYLVIDGSDSPPQSGTGLFGDCYNFEGNIFRHLCNAVVCNNMHLVHDNLFEYVDENSDGSGHGNVFESNSESNQINSFYNNVIRHIGTLAAIGVNVWLYPYSTDYIFNNLLYDIVAGTNYWDANTGSSTSWYLFNNTFQVGSASRMVFNQNNTPVMYSYNNHYITDYGTSESSVFAVTTNLTYSNDIIQSNSTANGQGYTSSEGYAYSPASGSAATVGAGTNKQSYCTALSSAGLSDAATACQSDTRYACTYNSSNHTVTCPARTVVARPSSGAWGVGAYQSASDPPASPTLFPPSVH